MAVSKATVRENFSARARVSDRRGLENSPEDEANHRHDGVGAAVGEASSEPPRWLWEGVEEPLMEDRGEPGRDERKLKVSESSFGY